MFIAVCCTPPQGSELKRLLNAHGKKKLQPNFLCLVYMLFFEVWTLHCMCVMLRKHTLTMPLVIQPTPEFVNVPHSLTLLSASIYGKYIGYKGK